MKNSANLQFLKCLVLWVGILFVTLGFSFDANARIKLDPYKVYRSGPIKAIQNKEINKKVYGIMSPSKDTSYNPIYGLCKDGDSLRTARKVKLCETYRVHFKEREKGRTYLDFEDKRLAVAETRKNNRESDYQCLGPSREYQYFPINYDEYQCVLYSVKLKDRIGSKTFTDRISARQFYTQEYHNESKSKQEVIKCLAEDWVPKKMPKTFRVGYFTSTDNENYIGKYDYHIPLCENHQKGKDIVIKASGEFSGTGFAIFKR